ncbi:MAG: thermonuclease family protein [Pseudomonadota bacterium]
MNRSLLAAVVAAFALSALAVPALAPPADAQPAGRKGAPAAAPAPPSDAPDCPGHGAMPATWNGHAYAVGGDTLGGVGLKPQIRLWGVQAPVLRDAGKVETVAGMRARAALADLLEKVDHKVKCRALKVDRDCRIVAQCTVDDGQGGDIGGALIAAGVAYTVDLEEALPWESRASQRYAGAEAEARKQRRGLWKEWLGEK